MKTVRQQLEDYKKLLGCHPVARLAVEAKMVLPDYYDDLGYFRQQAERAKAFDRACAAELGVTLDPEELEERYRDKTEEEAQAWAEQLPDMPKQSYSSYRVGVFG